MYRVFDNMKTLHRKIDPKSSAFFNSKYITPRGKEIATAETLIGLTESNASKHEEYELHDDGGIGGNIASRTTVKKNKRRNIKHHKCSVAKLHHTAAPFERGVDVCWLCVCVFAAASCACMSYILDIECVCVRGERFRLGRARSTILNVCLCVCICCSSLYLILMDDRPLNSYVQVDPFAFTSILYKYAHENYIFTGQFNTNKITECMQIEYHQKQARIVRMMSLICRQSMKSWQYYIYIHNNSSVFCCCCSCYCHSISSEIMSKN